MKQLMEDAYEKIAFLEPKDYGNSPLIQQIGLNTPIPILVEDMVREISSREAEENIDGQAILKGMIYLLGVDPDFKYNSKYLEVLNEHKNGVLIYINQLMAQAIQRSNVTDAYIYANAKTQFDPSAQIEKNFALENIYNKHWPPSSEEEAKELSELLKEIIKNYESILEEDQKNAQANLRLAEIYKAMGQFIKSRLYYERALHQFEGEDQGAIRNALEEISNDVHLESAETYLVYGRFSDALNELDQITDTYLDPGKIYYQKGIAYDGLGDLASAEDNYKKAIEEDGAQGDYYNNYAILLSNRGKMKEALETLTIGLEINPDDKKLSYNRGSIYYYMGELKLALNDFTNANKDQDDPRLSEIINNIKQEMDQ